MLSSLIGPQHDVVVFDLGTNDSSPDDYASSLAAARGIAGDRCLVLATLNRPPLNGSPVEPLDRVLARFATRSPNVELVDWRGAVAQRPELLTDGIHATPEGYSLRAGLFADAIESCLALGPTSAGDSRGEGRGAGRQTDTHASEPEPRLARDHSRRPLDVVAVELAKAIAVGAEFG